MKNKFSYIENRIKFFIGALLAVMLAMVLILFAMETRTVWIKAAFLVFLLAAAVSLYLAYSYIYKPYQADKKVKTLFARGEVYNDIFSQPYAVSEADEAVLMRFSEMLETQKLINSAKKEAEYLALQNQINPHFLYNTLEGIRSEALIAGVDSIAEMTEALSTFFRYTISQTGNLVSLEDELANIENYYYIQQFRFGDKLELSIEYSSDEDLDEADILKLKLPKLTLQPIVENAIYHGIESKIGKGHLKIRITATRNHLIIKVSDDGTGIEKEQLAELNGRLRFLSMDEVTKGSKKKGGIAIRNVNNRIKLLFGEDYGIYIYSHQEVGTDVEITLPVVKQDMIV